MLRELIHLYEELCSHCDTFFAAACREFPEAIECRPGCYLCCTIQSVTRIEAFVIEEFSSSRPLRVDSNSSEFCIFLTSGQCSIYPVRPIICRTHGLLLYNSEEREVRQTCKMNFKRLAGHSHTSVRTLDEVNITENLIRLNLAFMKLTGLDSSDDPRLSLAEVTRKIHHTQL